MKEIKRQKKKRNWHRFLHIRSLFLCSVSIYKKSAATADITKIGQRAQKIKKKKTEREREKSVYEKKEQEARRLKLKIYICVTFSINLKIYV